jgi:hypothetical protein
VKADPKNVRDALLEAGYDAEAVERGLFAMNDNPIVFVAGYEDDGGDGEFRVLVVATTRAVAREACRAHAETIRRIRLRRWSEARGPNGKQSAVAGAIRYSVWSEYLISPAWLSIPETPPRTSPPAETESGR